MQEWSPDLNPWAVSEGQSAWNRVASLAVARIRVCSSKRLSELPGAAEQEEAFLSKANTAH